MKFKKAVGAGVIPEGGVVDPLEDDLLRVGEEGALHGHNGVPPHLRQGEKR